MKIKHVYQTLLAALWLSQLTVAAAAEFTSFVVAKGQDYYQTNTDTVLTLTNNRPFKFTAFVDASATDSLQSVTLKLPNTQVRALTNNDGNFAFETGFTNKTALDAAYGVGSYLYTISGTHDGTNKPVLALPADNFPPVPQLGNWGDVQSVEAAQPLNLVWNTFTNGTTNDFILLSITTPDGSPVVSTPALFAADALNGTNLTAQIPADTLSDGATYQGSLLFVKRTTLNTNFLGVNGLAGYFRQTDFPLTTLPTPPANGRIQFASSRFSVLENAGTATITLTRSGTTGVVSVDLGTQDGTAHDGQDYTGFYRTVSFDDGQASIDYQIGINDDFLLNGNRTLTVSLYNPQGGAELGIRSNAVLTIVDNETAAAGKLQFATRSNSVPEAARFVTLTVNRGGGSTGTVSVNYATADATAIAGLNYVATNGTLEFGPGSVSKTIQVPILNDSLYESNEVFLVTLSNPTGGAAYGTNLTTQVSIINDDSGGIFAFKQSTYVTNENAGNFLVTVVRTGGTAGGVTVHYATVDGTALAGVRYYATNGTLSFGANELSKTFQVGIINDNLLNGDQSFVVQLSNATGGATVSTNTTAQAALLTIRDDESSVSFTNTTFTLGERAGTFTTTVVRSGSLLTPVSVDYLTSDVSTTAGLDYRATNGTLVFPPNVKAKTISVAILNNPLATPAKTFQLSLANPANGLQLDGISTISVTLTNDNLGGVISFAQGSYTVSEAATNAIITLVRSNGLASGVSVAIGAVAGTAVAGQDFVNPTNTVRFAAGETSRKVIVPVINNNVVDGDRTVAFALSNPAGGATVGTNFGNTCWLTITNEDRGGVISFARTNYSATKNATNFYVTINRTGGKATGVGIFYMTHGGTATQDVDYVGVTNAVFFSISETNKVIAIPIINDNLVEGTESFTVSLFNPLGGATLGAATNATLNILDDESSISLSNAAVSVGEAAGKVVITLLRSGALGMPVSVDFATADGSASAGLDYGATNGTVTFPANVRTRTITIPIVNDTLAEADKDFTFTLSNPQGGAQLGANTLQTITIVDNEVSGTLQFAATNFIAFEGSNAVVRITRTGGLASGVSVDLTLSDGTALAGTDYTNVSQTVTFNAGETNKSILVALPFDALNTTSRTANLALSNPTGYGAALGTLATATLTINAKPDPNAIPEAGPVFFAVTADGVAVTGASLLVTNFSDLSGIGSNSLANFTGSKVVASTASVTGKVFNFENIVANGTGPVTIDSSTANGTVLFTLSSGQPPAVTTTITTTADTGGGGTIFFDVINKTSKTITGRFDLTTVAAGGGSPHHIVGSFRYHY